MKNQIHTDNSVSEKKVIETLFCYLDKGIDDIEADRIHKVNEAFQIIKERMLNEL